MSSDQIIEIPLEEIRPSPYNINRPISEQALAELAQNIKSVGRVLSPILVRPVDSAGQADAWIKYEIVFGERRWRGSRIAGLPTVRSMVEEMTDEEAKQARLIENIQREDTSPLDEATGLQDLIDNHGHTAKTLEPITRRSKAHIYNRLRLLKLEGKPLEAVRTGLVGGDIGAVIASQPKSLQDKALELSLTTDEDGKVVAKPYRVAKNAISEQLMIPIIDARFDPKSTAYGDKPPCSQCSALSQNDEVLSTELDPDVCTNSQCFDIKTRMDGQIKVEEAKDAGQAVLEGADVSGLFNKYGGLIGHVDLTHSMSWRHPGGFAAGQDFSWLKALQECRDAGELVPEPIHLQHPNDGHAMQVLSNADIDALRAAFFSVVERREKAQEAESPPSTAAQAQPRTPNKWQLEQEAKLAALTPEQLAAHKNWAQIRKAIMQRACGAERTLADLRLIAEYLAGQDTLPDEVALAMGWTDVADCDHDEHDDLVSKRLDTASADQMATLITLLSIHNCPGFQTGEFSEAAEARVNLAKRYDVDVLAFAGADDEEDDDA